MALLRFCPSAQFSPDGTHIIVAADDKTVRVRWALELLHLPELDAHPAVFSLDGVRDVGGLEGAYEPLRGQAEVDPIVQTAATKNKDKFESSPCCVVRCTHASITR